MVFVAGERPTATKLNIECLPGRRIAWTRRTTSKSLPTGAPGTETGVLRLDDIPMITNRLYMVCYQCTPDISGGTATNILTQLRYTTDGSTPSLSSTILPDTGSNVGDERGMKMVSADFVPGSAVTFSVTLYGQANGTTASIFADSTRTARLWIQDCGPDPGDTGTAL